jgi:hypothetical protein
MKLVLERLQMDPDVTIGSLTIDGAWECWTLEDAVRPDGVKIYGETAIPPGLYRGVRARRRRPLGQESRPQPRGL